MRVIRKLSRVCVGVAVVALVDVSQGAEIAIPAESTYIRSDNVNGNFQADVFGVVGTIAGSAARPLRTLFQFDSSLLPAGSTITSVDLRTYHQREDSTPSSVDVLVHALTKTFSEGSATWANASTGNPWTTSGGDFDGTVLASGSTGTSAAGTEILLTETSAFTSYVQSRVGSGSTIDLIMKASASDETLLTRNLIFVATEDNASVKPVLHVTYVPEPVALPLLGAVGLLLARRRRTTGG